MVSVVTDFFWCVISFLQTYSGAVTAVATIAISIFTYFLVRVSNRQARLTKTIIELTNKEYVSTHRPILRIRRITLTDFHERIGIDEISHGDKVFIKIVVVNVGGTPAIVINSKYRIFFFQGQFPLEITYDDPPFNLTKQTTIFSEGQHRYFEVSADAILKDPGNGMRKMRQFKSENWSMLVVGEIEYRDDIGLHRFTGFLRKWDSVGGFCRTNNSDYEYED